ncbi:OmpA family protein [Nocardia takedensis]|uniref:OmpA family protein n=1 Tax=Nocardia takedensis TaxID=259390 RepID=UPI0002EA4EB8|nr:OmpA family protein [Nocardia takedensis]
MSQFLERSSRTVRAVVAVAVTLGVVSACGSDSEGGDPATRDADAVVIVADTHANAPAPDLDKSTRDLLGSVMRNGGLVELVRVSARPELVELEGFREVTGTDAGKKMIVRRNLEVIDRALDVGSAHDGADDLEAISIAADSIRTRTARHPTIVVTGSGLSDSGRLSFTSPGMLTASPREVTEYLASTGALPDLKGITVRLVGLGYVAGPQQLLDATQRANVVAIWRGVLEAAGASVVVVPDPRTDGAVPTQRTVRPVDVPVIATPAMCTTREIVFTDQSQVSFLPETTTFVDSESAATALTPIARWLAEDADRTARVRGTTADDRGDRARLVGLGQRRADAVAQRLSGDGARATQITAVGVGADFPEYVRPDSDPVTGLLLPGPASLNRSVRITLVDPC